MGGKIDAVREALETLCEALELALARLGVCGQGDGADHKADADSIGGTNALTMGRSALSALSALSAIDPGAIRRKFVALFESGRMKYCSHTEGCSLWNDNATCSCGYDNWLSSILSVEPAQDDGKPEVGDVVAVRFTGVISRKVWQIMTWTPECEDSKWFEEVRIIERAAEVKRRLEEDEE